MAEKPSNPSLTPQPETSLQRSPTFKKPHSPRISVKQLDETDDSPQFHDNSAINPEFTALKKKYNQLQEDYTNSTTTIFEQNKLIQSLTQQLSHQSTESLKQLKSKQVEHESEKTELHTHIENLTTQHAIEISSLKSNFDANTSSLETQIQDLEVQLSEKIALLEQNPIMHDVSTNTDEIETETDQEYIQHLESLNTRIGELEDELTKLYNENEMLTQRLDDSTLHTSIHSEFPPRSSSAKDILKKVNTKSSSLINNNLAKELLKNDQGSEVEQLKKEKENLIEYIVKTLDQVNQLSIGDKIY